ncbi:MAG: M48 family metalloprotease [Fuerstiella sp.]
MMERGDFDDLVDRIERQFEGRAEALTAHTWRWLLLGYTVVICLTVLLVGGGLAIFIAGILASKPGILLVIAGGALMTFGLGQVGALVLVDLVEPHGRRLKADEAPELHKLLTLLSDQIGSKPPTEILLTDEFNAAIVQHPRLGIFGWSKSWLILGVPLLLAVSPAEFAAVLAHECGHLSMKHGRHGNRIYLMHQSWDKLFQRLQQKAGSGFVRTAGALVLKFLTWYWPRFHARAFVLSRQNEFLADQLAVRVTSVDYAASALWRIECTGLLLENDFWKKVWDQAAVLPEPPDDLCDRLRTAFRNAPAATDSVRWCDDALRRVSNHEDTHPSLSARLRALGVDPEVKRAECFPAAPELTAADALLADDLSVIETEINRLWAKSVRAIWQDRHRRIAAIQKLTLAETKDAESDGTTAAELWNQTRAVLDVQGLEAAEPLLRRLLAVDPEHVGATFALGQLRLIQGHADGEELLQHVVSLQTAEWTQPAGAVLERHLSTRGMQAQVRQLRHQLDQFEKARTEAEKERTDIRRSDVFLPHGLSDPDLRKVQAALLKQTHCEQAWLVQKDVRLFPEERLYVLCVDSRKSAGGLRVERNDRMITSLMLSVEVPGRLFVVNPTGEFRTVAKRLIKHSEWQIFERTELNPESDAMNSDQR